MELVRRIGDMRNNLMKGVRNALLPLPFYLMTPSPVMEFMVREYYNFMPVPHLYGSILGGEDFFAEAGGECGGAFLCGSIHAISCLYTNLPFLTFRQPKQ